MVFENKEENTPMEKQERINEIALWYGKHRDNCNAEDILNFMDSIGYSRGEKSLEAGQYRDLIADLKRVGHHTIDDELWRIEKHLKGMEAGKSITWQEIYDIICQEGGLATEAADATNKIMAKLPHTKGILKEY